MPLCDLDQVPLDAGLDALGIFGTILTLDGSATDPNGDSLTTQWELISVPDGSTSTVYKPSSLTASFVPDLPGVYVARLVAEDVPGAGTPDDVQCTVTTSSSYSAIQIQATAAALVASAPGSVTDSGNQNALLQYLSIATAALDAGDVAEAIQKLRQAIARTDGCAVRGSLDGCGQDRDWITSCAAQQEIYPLLVDALAALAL